MQGLELGNFFLYMEIRNLRSHLFQTFLFYVTSF